MLSQLTEQEYYGQNPCVEPRALLDLIRAIASRGDYPPQPRFLDTRDEPEESQ